MRARRHRLHRHQNLNEFGDTIDFGDDWSDQVIGDVNECLGGGTDDRPAGAAAQQGGDAS